MSRRPLNRQRPPVVVADDPTAVAGSESDDDGQHRKTVPAADWSGLMVRAQSGDSESYRRLLEQIVPYLRSLVARRHRDARDVEDTVQDILLTVHAIRHTYDPARPFGPWLVAIAHRRVIDRLRQLGRSRLRDAALRTEYETFGPPQANIYETKPDEQALRQAVERLPPGQRQAVTLLKLREMSLSEAAAISGMSVGALKVAMHRALKNLRSILVRKSEKT